MKCEKALVLGVVMCSLMAGLAHAAEVTIDVAADARTWKHATNVLLEQSNFGTFHRTDARVAILDEVAGRPVDLQGLLKFDIDMTWLQSLDASDIVSATFKGNGWSLVNAPTDANDHIDVNLITEADWTENGVSYVSRDGVSNWNTAGTPGSVNVISAPFGPFPNAPLNDNGTPEDPNDDFNDPGGSWFEDFWEQDASAMVEMWRSGSPNYGLFITRSGFVADDNVHYSSFWSKEAEADQENRPGAKAPQLVITVVPEPTTTVMLCIGGVVGLMAFKRRRLV